MSPKLPIYLDNTMRTVFVRCPRKFYNEFCLGLAGAGTSIDLHAGACIAHCFETVYNLVHMNGMSFESAIKRGEAQFTIDWGDVEPEWRWSKRNPNEKIYSSPKTRERCWEAILNYFHVYPPRFDHIQPLRSADKATVEFTFAIPLTEQTLGYPVPLHPSGEPFLYCGRFDFLGKYNNRIILPLDHKTAKYADENWTEKWDLRSQFLGYVWACEHIGLDVQKHFAVRGIIIQKTQLQQLEAIKTYPRELVDRWRGQLSRDIHRLVDCWNSGYFDYDLAEACTDYGLCQYFHACRAPDPNLWLKDMQPRYWNPLAKNPIAEPVPEHPTPVIPEPNFVEA
jgi:hypothetical protein